MAETPSRTTSDKPKTGARPDARDRMPTNAELLHELRLHGTRPKPPRELPLLSRRTRDYLLIAGLGSAAIVFASFRMMTGSDTLTILRLALTGVALLSGLLWFIFYGVMSRY